jgi:hypothetical protein
VSGGFSSVVEVGWSIKLYAALVALLLNLLVAAGVTFVLRRSSVGMP